MRKPMLMLLSAILVLNLALAISSTSQQSSYAEDRAQIEDLLARYTFALDFYDVDAYVSSFTKDGTLDLSTETVRGHDALRALIARYKKDGQDRAAKEAPNLRPSASRHIYTNMVIKIDGNKAAVRAYWFFIKNSNPERATVITNFGHFEDDIVKVNGKWLISKHRTYNEASDKRPASGINPAW